MKTGTFKLQMVVFALVSASFTNIYITQPILPVLQEEFSVSPVQVSMTVSLVILGIVLSNLFFGFLADKIAIQPIILIGGICVASGGLVAAWTHDFRALVMARMFQGLFIPALTTSLAAWLAKTLPRERLTIIMGSYVSATVLGGLGGRLLGGWIHPPLHWRYAFVSASGLILLATFAALVVLPRSGTGKKPLSGQEPGFIDLLLRRDLLPLYACGAGSLLIFSPVFNFLPYRLAGDPFHFSTELITLIYFVYILGIFLGPLAGRISNSLGGGQTLIVGTLVLGGSLTLLLVPWVPAVILGLLGVCAGFFTIHSVAVGLLNQKLSGSQGKANALYVLFYYCGGWLGITGAGYGFQEFGWNGVVGFVICFLAVPLVTGIMEKRG
ncbi:MFS transporter [Desulfospira joergensenii]|uniref:MFS transporter n=1 Tax=Desulfospira joergensenii TaxID=53329 RepID=UPI0003B74288|nr:MFS transporter [Desulfospira joergensenii]